ncbi:MAG: MarR family transcriptional regulator [Xanthomonadales bacterium]|nr:MarR family transcriptional regulator [Xanthomonadales bacterium]
MHKDHIDALQDDWSRQRPDLDSAPMGVVLRIQALAKILTQQAADSLEKYGLQWWQYDVLSTLRRQGEPHMMAATALADAAMLTSGAMTNRIDRLEAEGLVRRLADPDDRRRVLVRLTRRGLDLIESAMEARFETAFSSLHGLSVGQRRQLSDLLRRVLSEQ